MTRHTIKDLIGQINQVSATGLKFEFQQISNDVANLLYPPAPEKIEEEILVYSPSLSMIQVHFKDGSMTPSVQFESIDL